MALEIYLTRVSGVFCLSSRIKAPKLKGHGQAWLDLTSAIAVTKLPPGHIPAKKAKRRNAFLKIVFLQIFLLSDLVIVHRASLLALQHCK